MVYTSHYKPEIEFSFLNEMTSILLIVETWRRVQYKKYFLVSYILKFISRAFSE